MSAEITPLILTYNEASNLRRTLDRLAWAKEVVVVDSGSQDETMAVAQNFPNVRTVVRTFDTHAAQWNFGLEQCHTAWVLSLDADYVLTPELEAELRRFMPPSDLMALTAQFHYCVEGHALRGTLYPARAVLFRRSACHYEQDGHTQTLRINGTTGSLRGRILHDDRKPLSQWLWAQDRYARLEAEKLLTVEAGKLRRQDRLRRGMVLAPIAVFFYTLLAKGLILDGWPGWFYVLQRTYAELLLSLRLLEVKLKRGS